MNELLRELACFGCSYNDECEDQWEEGHSHCNEMMDNAKTFAKRTGIMDMMLEKINISGSNKKGDDMKTKEIVYVYTDCLNSDHVGDLVRCMNCGALMLMQLGGTACGECESEKLEWADRNKQEWSYEEIEAAGYIIVEK